MILLAASIVIALTMIMIGMFIMSRAGRNVNMDRLSIFIAIAAGFMVTMLFIDLLPENLEKYPGGGSLFFKWALLGIGLVIAFERYGVPRLKFVDRFFDVDAKSLKHIHTHDGHVHAGGGHGDHAHHDHHDHHNLNEATHCDHSHEHGHIHQHTHPTVLGHGAVCSAIGCFMICSFFDGISLSSVQAVDPQLGLLLIVGVVLHLLPEGVLSGAMALAGGASVHSAKKILLFIGGSFVAGSLIPFLIHGFESAFLALSSGILIFVTMVQLLPTALKLKFAPAWIALGAAIFAVGHEILEMLGVHH